VGTPYHFFNWMNSDTAQATQNNAMHNQMSWCGAGFIKGDDYIVIGHNQGLERGFTYPGGTFVLRDPSDWANYYWKFSLTDLANQTNPYDTRPYDYGAISESELGVPGMGKITYAQYKGNKLYVCCPNDDTRQNQYEPCPVIYVYEFL